jgi:hypothetical protein
VRKYNGNVLARFIILSAIAQSQGNTSVLNSTQQNLWFLQQICFLTAHFGSKREIMTAFSTAPGLLN